MSQLCSVGACYAIALCQAACFRPHLTVLIPKSLLCYSLVDPAAWSLGPCLEVLYIPTEPSVRRKVKFEALPAWFTRTLASEVGWSLRGSWSQRNHSEATFGRDSSLDSFPRVPVASEVPSDITSDQLLGLQLLWRCHPTLPWMT